jgi:Arc/MetJ family transcription regulator
MRKSTSYIDAIILCMRTTVDVDDKLLDEAVRLSGRATRSGAVQEALREYVRLRRKELLLELPGRVRLEENWRALRESELREPADSR